MREYTKSYLSSEDWKEVLLELDSIGNAYSRRILEVINCLFKSSNYKLNAKAIGETIGTAYQRLNSDIGGFGKLLYNKYKDTLLKDPPLRKNGEVRYWHIVFDGEDSYKDGKGIYYWQLKNEMVQAIKELYLFHRTKEEKEKSSILKEQIRIVEDSINFKGEEKRSFVKIRVNQSKLRTEVLRHIKTCQICGLNKERLLIISHIKPWAKSLPEERTNLNNVILLCPNHDALFDKGFISFSDDGKILLSSDLSSEDLDLMNIDKEFTLSISDEMRKYLKYHRENIFKK